MSVLTLSNGARLNYGETGTGPTIIMVHGSPGEGRAWASVIKQLAGDLHILTPDLPGYGGSDPLPRETQNRTEAMASAISELIVTCDGPVWLCGHSYGANVALHTAEVDVLADMRLVVDVVDELSLKPFSLRIILSSPKIGERILKQIGFVWLASRAKKSRSRQLRNHRLLCCLRKKA